jgi:hypothetical protein
VQFLLNKLAVILIAKVFGKSFIVSLFAASWHIGATITCVPLSDYGTSGSPSLSFRGMMPKPCALTRWGFYMSRSDRSRSPPFKLWFRNGWRTLRWWVLLSVHLWFRASSWILGLRKGPMSLHC